MPWIVKKNGDKYCLYKKGDGSLVSGSCHTNRADTVKQMRAMYANEGKNFSERSVTVPVKNFSASLIDVKEGELPWIQIFPFGHWPHPVYGDTTVNHKTASDYVKNFKENVRRIEINTDYEHGLDKAKGSKASGWYRDMELRDDGVYAQIEFTPTALSEIKEGEWKYFSPMFYDDYLDEETGETFENVVVGGGLTNKPIMKDMIPINFAEAVLEEETTKFRYKDGKWIASDNNGESWRVVTKAEEIDMEHSEPGTGTPPAPREDGEDISGDKDGEGIRRDSPPPQDTKEGSDVKLEKATLEALGLEEDADEAAINTEIVELAKTVAPLKEFHEQNKKAKKFAEEFPEEAERMQKLQKAEDDRIAKNFSERYERIVTLKGEGEDAERVSTNKGLSGLALDKIEGIAKKFHEGTASVNDLQEVLDVLTTDKAIVDYGEVGSGRVRENVGGEGSSAAKLLSEKASDILDKKRSEGTPVSYEVALHQAAAENPDLAREYMDAEEARRVRSRSQG
jgi:hypothetical protein